MFDSLVGLVGNTDVAITIVMAGVVLIGNGIINEVKHIKLRHKYSWLRK